MEKLPTKIQKLYVDFLKKKGIPSEQIPFYVKWLRYYFDFCSKYHHEKSDQQSFDAFLLKLRQKNQTEQQIKQAKQSITYFYILIEIYKNKNISSPSQNNIDAKPVVNKTANELDNSKNQSWQKQYQILKDEIQLRQYSPRTLKNHTHCVRKFQAYLKSKSPQLVESTDAKKFITYLAVEKQVSSSIQNQVFNSLLFFYRHVLKKDFGDFENIPHAKRTKYTPAVLSRKDIDTILDNLEFPYSLVVCNQKRTNSTTGNSAHFQAQL